MSGESTIRRCQRHGADTHIAQVYQDLAFPLVCLHTLWVHVLRAHFELRRSTESRLHCIGAQPSISTPAVSTTASPRDWTRGATYRMEAEAQHHANGKAVVHSPQVVPDVCTLQRKLHLQSTTQRRVRPSTSSVTTSAHPPQHPRQAPTWNIRSVGHRLVPFVTPVASGVYVLPGPNRGLFCTVKEMRAHRWDSAPLGLTTGSGKSNTMRVHRA